MLKIVSIGEIMLEMSHVGDDLYRKNFAGDSFNLAYYLNAVSHGANQVNYLTVLGADEVGEQCLQFMQTHGVNISTCERDSERTIGLYILSNDADGEKHYGYWRSQSAARYLFNNQRDLSGYDWICFSAITAAIMHHRDNLIASILSAKQAGARLVYDCNYRELLWTPEDAHAFASTILSQIDLAKISDDELELMFPGTSMQTLSSTYPLAEWVVTCQSRKSEVWNNGVMIAQQTYQPNAVDVVDTSGAGDAFLASYLSAKLDGLSVEESLHKGHSIASQVVCVKGSIADVDL